MIEKLFQKMTKRPGILDSSNSTSIPQIFSAWLSRSSATQTLASDDTWSLAVQNYCLSCEQKPPQKEEQPKMFQSWGELHLSLAEIIWIERKQLNRNIVHIYDGKHLLAEINPKKFSIYIRDTRASSSLDKPIAEGLNWRNLPASAREFSDPQQHGFEPHNISTLLWYFGQLRADALQLLPAEIGQNWIQLKRMPNVEPAALKLRHLVLFQAFKAGSLQFRQLRNSLPPEQWSQLCPDIASLYLTGCLRLHATP